VAVTSVGVCELRHRKQARFALDLIGVLRRTSLALSPSPMAGFFNRNAQFNGALAGAHEIVRIDDKDAEEVERERETVRSPEPAAPRGQNPRFAPTSTRLNQ
jgi:hypothetical protein